jgi:hypothetical protein
MDVAASQGPAFCLSVTSVVFIRCRHPLSLSAAGIRFHPLKTHLSPVHKRLLLALAAGWSLKAHRDIEGRKQFQLHYPDRPAEPVAWEVAEYLADHGLIDSNKKFPAATFWLTDKGKAATEALSRDRAPR